MVEEDFQAGKGLAALDEHQVRRRICWYRWATLAMLALAFLTVAALAEQAQPPPPGLILLTRNEIARLAAVLIIQPVRDARHRLRWSAWRRRTSTPPRSATAGARQPTTREHDGLGRQLELRGGWLIARQRDEPRGNRSEPACLDVETSNVVFEVGVEPLTSRSAGVPGGSGDQPGADAVAPNLRGHEGIDDEGVDPSVPGHVHEPHQVTTVPGAHPAKTVLLHLGAPVDINTPVTETLRVQDADGCVFEVTAPLIADRHPAIVEATSSARQASSAAGHDALQRAHLEDHDLLREY
jgi:hypothetical protein